MGKDVTSSFDKVLTMLNTWESPADNTATSAAVLQEKTVEVYRERNIVYTQQKTVKPI